MADTDDKIKELKEALDKVSAFLDKPEVRTALGQIPASIKGPVFEGLKQVLDVIKTALNELKANLGAVTTVKDLLKVINDLLDAAKGLASGEEETLNRVKGILDTLQSLPGAADIEAVIAKIQEIIQKIESL
jgi:hypothetical protein